MFIVFFQNMTLIIALTYVYIKLQAIVFAKNNNKNVIFWLNCCVMGLLSVLIMLNPFMTTGLFFDLRSVPIFFLAYKFGFKAGLIASIIPSLYRWYLSSFAALQGIVMLILLPMVIGALFGIGREKKKEYELIDIKKIISVFLFNCFIQTGLLWFTLSIPFSMWLGSSFVMTIYSVITLLLIVTMTNDLYKSFRSEKILKRNAEDYRKLVEMLPDAIIVYKDDKIVYVNSAAVKLLGSESDESLIRKKISQVVKNYQILIDINKRISSTQLKNDFAMGDAKLELRNGKNLDVEIRGAFFDSGGESFIYNVVRDVTVEKMAIELEQSMHLKQKQLQEAIEYERVKSDFFSNLSHELKTPVNLIFSTIQLMELDFKREKHNSEYMISKRFRILKQNCNRMIRLINNLIDVTKMDSGYYQLTLKKCNIVNVIEDITLSVAEYIENNDISLVFDTDIEEKYLMIDPNAIERIMLNLLSNSVKFTRPNNEIYVNIHDAVDHVIISVKDKGMGIPKDKLEVIFDRFRQVDKSLTRTHEGSGIGLSLVKSLIMLHSGEINVESKYGERTEFIIVFPVKEIIMEEEEYEYDSSISKDNCIETIKIEFSDIYSIS